MLKDASAKGKMSKNKGANYERKISKIFSDFFGYSFIRTPLSGGFAKQETSQDFKGDITPADRNKPFPFLVECKNQERINIKDWIKQAQEESAANKIPLVIFHMNRGEDYVCLNLKHFLSIINIPE